MHHCEVITTVMIGRFAAGMPGKHHGSARGHLSSPELRALPHSEFCSAENRGQSLCSPFQALWNN